MTDAKLAPMVEISNLWVKYGSVEAVRGISFTIPRGEVFGFIGPNGAGKSSTIRVLATLQSPWAGWAKIDGIEVRQNPTAIRRKIGYMPDYFGLYEDLTVREYLHFFAAAYDLPEANRDRLVDDVLTLTDLTHKIDTLVDHLSRGMKQRLGLARVLLARPGALAARRAGQRPGPAGPDRSPRDSQGALRHGQDDPDLQPHPARVVAALHADRHSRGRRADDGGLAPGNLSPPRADADRPRAGGRRPRRPGGKPAPNSRRGGGRPARPTAFRSASGRRPCRRRISSIKSAVSEPASACSSRRRWSWRRPS